MLALVAVFCAFLLGLYLYSKNINPVYAWLLSSCVVPVYILVAEFLLPYMGGGASLWPIALIFGGFYGFVAGGLGVFIGSIVKK